MPFFNDPPVIAVPTTPFLTTSAQRGNFSGPFRYTNIALQERIWIAGFSHVGAAPPKGQVKIARSDDALGTGTWSVIDQTNAPALADLNQNFGDFVFFFDSTNGRLHALGRSAGSTLSYVYMDLNTETYVPVVTSAIGAERYLLTQRQDGSIIVVYAGANNTDLKYLTVSSGGFGSPATLVSAVANTAFYPLSAILDSAGTLHIAYQQVGIGGRFAKHIAFTSAGLVSSVSQIDNNANYASNWPDQYGIGLGAIWNNPNTSVDHILWAANTQHIDGGVLLYDGTPISAPVWATHVVRTVPEILTGCNRSHVIISNPGLLPFIFWYYSPLDVSTSQVQSAVYDGTTFTSIAVAWDLLTNHVVDDPTDSAMDTFSIAATNNAFELVGDEYINSDYDQSLVFLAALTVTITCGNPPDGVVGTVYGPHTFPASGGISPYVFTLNPGDFLPPGLSLDATTGIVSGIPTVAGLYSFIIQVADAFNSVSATPCSINITGAIVPPIVNTSTLIMVPGTVPNIGTSGAGTSNTIQATAGSGGGGPITVTLVSGILPPGTTLASDLTNNTGVISGFIPPNSGPDGDGTGIYTIFVTATDNNGTTTAMIVITVRKPAECNNNSVPTIDPELAVCECPANSTTILDIANWAAVGKLKRWDILPDAVEAAVDVYRGVCGKVPFDILRHISQEFRLTAGQAAYSLSCFEPSVLGIISVRLTYGTNKFRRMRRSDGRVYDSLGSLISSIPATYCRFGSTIEFNPMPSGASQTYRLRYWSSPPFNHLNVGNTILVTPPDWDELFKWETLYRMYIHLDMFEKAQALVNPVGMQRQQSPKRTIMFETAIIPRLWNDLLLTISQRENVDEDFSINPLIRNYTRT